jgi:hypothetical protein
VRCRPRSVVITIMKVRPVYRGVNDPAPQGLWHWKALSVLSRFGWKTLSSAPWQRGMGYNFVCVESVKFDPVTVDGGKSWEVLMLSNQSASKFFRFSRNFSKSDRVDAQSSAIGCSGII